MRTWKKRLLKDTGIHSLKEYAIRNLNTHWTRAQEGSIRVLHVVLTMTFYAFLTMQSKLLFM